MAKLSGIGTEVGAAHQEIFATRNGALFLPGGKIIEGAYARDPGNTNVAGTAGYNTTTLRAGLLMGKVTATGKYRPVVIGQLQVAYTSGGTAITLTVPQAKELVRRVGATGAVNVIGPPTAADTVAVVTNKAYSDVNTGTGVVTIANIGANMIAGSLVTEYNVGTEYPVTLITDPYGVKVTDENEENIDIALELIPVMGILKTSIIIDAMLSPLVAATNTTMAAWVKQYLRVKAPGLVFDDDY